MLLSVGGGWYYYHFYHRHGLIVAAKPKEGADADINADDSEIAAPQAVPTNVSCVASSVDFSQEKLLKNGQILFATTIPKTGELGLLGRALSDGLFLCLNKTNTLDGGIWKDSRVSLDQRDDNGRISHALPLVYDLLTRTKMFFSPAGEVVFEKIYLPLLAQKALVVLMPAIGMRAGITASMPVVWFRPSYAREITTLLDYAVNTLKQKQIAVFYEDSTWGLEAKNVAEYILSRKYNLSLCAAAPYQPSTVTIQSAVADIKKTGPQVIVCLASGRPTYNFIREAINQQLHYASFLGLSRVASIAPQLKASRGIELITTSVVPNPFNSQLQVVQEYRKFMQQFLPNKGLSSDTLEGYIAASLLIYFLKQVGPAGTINDLLHVIDQTDTLIFKGLKLTYKEKTLSWSVWINKGIDVEWPEYCDGQ